MNHKVLVMIPAYNEEKTVGEIVKSTLALYPDFKVVVIDDGSNDRTADNAQRAGADVVSLPFHCGGAIAIQTGYLMSVKHGFDFTVKIDADGQHKPEDIPKLLSPLFEDEADITIGSRYLSKNTDNDSAVKIGGRFFSSTLVSVLRKMNVTDVTSGMRAWSRRAIQTLLHAYFERKMSDDSVFWVKETLIASERGLRIKEVAVEVLPRKYGESKSFSRGKMLLYSVRLITALIEEIVA